MTESIVPPDRLAALPILPLRNAVLFPSLVMNVNVGRPSSVRLVEALRQEGTERPFLGVLAQRDPRTDEPGWADLYAVGAFARVLSVERLGGGHYAVTLQGTGRFRVAEPLGLQPYLRARVEPIASPPPDPSLKPLADQLKEAVERLYEAVPRSASLERPAVERVVDPGVLADLVASHLPLDNEAKQRLLETLDVEERLRRVMDLVARRREVYRLKREVTDRMQQEMARSQREILLREQMRAIRRELGEEDEADEIEELAERIARAELPPEAERTARKQLGRLRGMHPASGEYQLTRTYLEWLADLPWGRLTTDRMDVAEARRVLEADHHGLKEPKRRIVEFLAVRKLKGDLRGPILCFVGPPGVGKTSLARSIARATGRAFERISLGGVHDEAEIRGHRRTYVGAYPGRFVAALKRAGSMNPVLLLDEVDKVGRGDHKGDPSAALLEVLDPEQNHAFVDHYLGLPLDLSKVLFIATANRLETIPRPLLDRMELIEIPGYTRTEKLAIARTFLVPRQLTEHGLTEERMQVADEALELLVDAYCREPGVRELERKIGSLVRAVAVRVAEGQDVSLVADADFVRATLGPPRHRPMAPERHAAVGVVSAMSVSALGGSILQIEAHRMRGSGRVHLTGRMGDVLQEAAHTAFSYVRARAERFGLPADFLRSIDVHLHLPEAATPKDGPAAGLPMLVALLSMLTRRPVRPGVAVAGEVTLRGAILPVTGIEHRILAAHRAGLTTVVLPARNAPDLEKVPEEVRSEVDLRLVSRVDEALQILLEPGAEVRSAAAPA